MDCNYLCMSRLKLFHVNKGANRRPVLIWCWWHGANFVNHFGFLLNIESTVYSMSYSWHIYSYSWSELGRNLTTVGSMNYIISSVLHIHVLCYGLGFLYWQSYTIFLPTVMYLLEAPLLIEAPPSESAHCLGILAPPQNRRAGRL